MLKETPNAYLQIKCGDDWEGVSANKSHFLRIYVEPDNMVKHHNYRWSEAQVYARKYRDIFLTHVKLPEGFSIAIEPDKNNPPSFSEPSTLIVETPSYELRLPSQSPYIGSDTMQKIQRAFEEAHAMTMQELEAVPLIHARDGQTGFRGGGYQGPSGKIGRRRL